MNKYTFEIPGRLPGINEFISAVNRNRYIGNALKRDSMHLVEMAIDYQLDGVKISNPVKVHYTWVEPNKKRDLDNISSYGRKVIQDALVNSGVLVNDGWAQIKGFDDSFAVDKDNPRIIVEIEEV